MDVFYVVCHYSSCFIWFIKMHAYFDAHLGLWWNLIRDSPKCLRLLISYTRYVSKRHLSHDAYVCKHCVNTCIPLDCIKVVILFYLPNKTSWHCSAFKANFSLPICSTNSKGPHNNLCGSLSWVRVQPYIMVKVPVGVSNHLNYLYCARIVLEGWSLHWKSKCCVHATYEIKPLYMRSL